MSRNVHECLLWNVNWSEPNKNQSEPTRNQLEPHKNQPGSAYSFKGVIFHGFACTSRSIVFAYLTRMKEDFILPVWGVCHLERTPWLLVTIFISLSRQGVQSQNYRKKLLYENVLRSRSTINILPRVFTYFKICVRNKKLSQWFWKQSHFCVKQLVPIGMPQGVQIHCQWFDWNNLSNQARPYTKDI